MTYEPTDDFEPDADRHLRQIIDLLTEIRDRLPEPQPESRPAPAVMFGYAMGSGEVPSKAQLACARGFLDGSLFHDSTRTPFYPTVAWELAREIVRMSEGSTDG
jgi:hypothetical protein